MIQLSIFDERHACNAQTLRGLLNVARVAGRLILHVAAGAGVAAVLVDLSNFQRLETCGHSQGFEKVFARVNGWLLHASEYMQLGWVFDSPIGTVGVL